MHRFWNTVGILWAPAYLCAWVFGSDVQRSNWFDNHVWNFCLDRAWIFLAFAVELSWELDSGRISMYFAMLFGDDAWSCCSDNTSRASASNEIAGFKMHPAPSLHFLLIERV